MMSLAKLSSAALVLVLAAVPLSGRAQSTPEKLYALELTSSDSVSVGDDVAVKAVFRNISPKNANSSFNALRLQGPPGVAFNSVSTPGCRLSPTPTTTTPATAILCENLSPVGKDGSFPVTFRAKIPVDTCGARWNPDPDDDVWSGSQYGSGAVFSLKLAPPNYPTYTATLTSSSPEVIVALDGNPSGVISGTTPYTGTATVRNACGTGAGNVPVTTSITPQGSMLTPNSGMTDLNGVFVFSATFGPGTTGSISVMALGTTGTASFGVYAGDLFCDEEIPGPITNPDSKTVLEPGWSASKRLRWNTDGAACLKTPYEYRNAILIDGSVSLRWPTDPASTQKAALFRTSANGPAKTLPATTDPYPTPKQPLFGWELTATGAPKYLTGALTCLDSEDPRPFAKLSALLPANAGTGTPFNVTFADSLPGETVLGWKALPAMGVEFDFNVGGVLVVNGENTWANERVRAKVTGINGATATLEVVARGRGQTPVLSHAVDAYIIPAVMPIDGRSTTDVYEVVNGEIKKTGTANPYYNKVVRMCTIAHGVQVYVPDPNGQSRYFEFIEYFDGDGALGFR